ncbi:DUF3102 domain-containing protein [Roseomonas genomospecies 6]|uniref:DUF3102 domain-containing protein n=1 Tax=Roseomonas genomospecies 6 TaxID=214106 RepID=A0A9W7TWC6_9PROT|nr:DUF3102 domain-containing protein [Roseomonas genomospecies 6]
MRLPSTLSVASWGCEMAGLQRAVKTDLAQEVTDPNGRFDDVRRSVGKLSSKDKYVETIGRLWKEATARFIDIGKYLVYAKDSLPHGEYEAMIESELPFSKSVAHALKTVADAVMQRKVTEADLPPDYSTSYLLVSLKDDKFAMAREHGLVRPSLKRHEILEFRRTLRTARPVSQRAAARRLARERERILADMAALQQRLTEVEAQMKTIDAEAATIIDVTPEAVDG